MFICANVQGVHQKLAQQSLISLPRMPKVCRISCRRSSCGTHWKPQHAPRYQKRQDELSIESSSTGNAWKRDETRPWRKHAQNQEPICVMELGRCARTSQVNILRRYRSRRRRRHRKSRPPTRRSAVEGCGTWLKLKVRGVAGCRLYESED